MNTEFEEKDVVSDHENWYRRLCAAGVYEREMERIRFSSMLDASQQGNYGKDEPFTFEEWLNKDVLFKHNNYCSASLLKLRQSDRWLWEYEPIPFNPESITSYLFDWDDVVHARATGKATTQQQWEQLVDQRYYADWLKYNVSCLQEILDPYTRRTSKRNTPPEVAPELIDPDKYTHWKNWAGEPILWKSIARFPTAFDPETVIVETSRVDPSSCISKDDYGKWCVRVSHEQGHIPLGEWYEKDDAIACAIEGIRCLNPNTRFSEAELAHCAATMDRREVEMAVAGLIGRWFYTHGRDTFPAHVEAIFALDALYNKNGQFERDGKGVWQLWCEAGDLIRSAFVSRAVAVPEEVSEALDRTWGVFISPDLDENYHDVESV